MDYMKYIDLYEDITEIDELKQCLRQNKTGTGNFICTTKKGSEHLLELFLSLLFSKCDYLYASTKNSTLLAIMSAIDSNPAMSRINGNKKS